MQDLGVLPTGSGSIGVAINDSGQVTGYAEVMAEPPHAFLWDGTPC